MGRAICSVAYCTVSPSKGRIYCSAHFEKWQRFGDPQGSKRGTLAPRGSDGERHCSVEGCEAPYASRGYCETHGHRFRKYGSPTGSKKGFLPVKVNGVRPCGIRGC